MKGGIKIGTEIYLNSKASVHGSLAIAPFLLKFIPPTSTCDFIPSIT